MAHTVLFPVFDRIQSLDLSGPFEVFYGANAYLAAYHPTAPSYTVRTASPGGVPVRASSGLTFVPDTDLDTEDAPDTVVVPGGDGARLAPPATDALAVVGWLRTHGPRIGRVASVCTGSFLLAEAGLLDGHRATTHWAHCDELAARHPAVTVDPDPIFVRDGRVVTSAGVTTGIDLALAIVEDDHGRDAALTIARYLVMFLRRPGNQAQYSALLDAQTAQRKPLRDVQTWIATHPDADLRVETLACRANLSPRQFARAFVTETGVTPGRYVDRVRLDHARRLLGDTRDGIEEVARASGYGTPDSMRRAFVKALGVTPTEYRTRF